VDIALSEGDLGLIETPLGPDLALEADALLLLKRALITPLGHLALLVQSNTAFRTQDHRYGNGIYRLLSEPQNLSWLEDSRATIEAALEEAQLEASVLSVEVVFPQPYEAQVLVSYQIQEEVYTLNLPVPLI
jgi:hypothetical protein